MNRSRLFLLISMVTIAVALLIVGYVIMGKEKKTPLPVYGWDDKTMSAHTIGDFKLINQEGKTITQENTKGHVYVANFFFATCPAICPRMNTQLRRVYEVYKSDDRVLFLSHTVKPESDSVPVLHDYAKAYGADAKSWWFLTGDKKELYNLARNSYLASVSEGDGGPDDFVHTQMLTLVDKERRIRGLYDGLDSVQVSQLIRDVNRLLGEYE